MNLKAFQYSLLKYCPSYALGEQVNVGIVFFFKEDLELKFIFPTALSRLHSLFPNVDVRILKSYIKNIKTKINALSKNKSLLEKSNFDELLQDHVLTPDSNSLYFDAIKTSKYTTVEQLLGHYYDLYFNVYKGKKKKPESSKKDVYLIGKAIKREVQSDLSLILTSSLVNKKDESYLKNSFKDELQKITNGNQEKLSLFKSKPIIKNKIGHTTFDFGWQNGTTNLVKFLSFDLADEGDLKNKSFRWYGELSQLEEQVRNENLKLDLLLTKPQNKTLFSSYDNVLQVLESIPTNKTIVEENQLKDYVSKAVETVKPFTNRVLFDNQKRLK